MLFRIPAKVRFLLCALLLAALTAVSAAAQQGTLTYGDRVMGALNATAPSAFFNFNGEAGDLVALRAVSLTPNLQLSLTLLSSSGPLAFDTGDGAALNGGDASITLRLKRSGNHQIFISSTNNAEGDFLLTLDRVELEPPASLSPDEGLAVDFPQGGFPQSFSLSSDGTNPLTLVIDSLDSAFPYSVWVLDSAGNLVASFSGTQVQNAALTFALGAGSYEVILFPLDAAAEGSLTISTSPQAAAEPSPTDAAPPAATETEAPPAGQPLEGVCSVTPANNAVNVRSGPGEGFGIVGSLPVGTYHEATARSSSDWYRVNLNGIEGWVAGFVVVANGPCAALPVIDAPAPVSTEEVGGQPEQQQPPTATQQEPPPTATQQEGQQQAPTATVAPTDPPPPAVAPEDARFNSPLEIPLDSTNSVTDFVSYPNGDTEDRVRFSVTGLNPNVALPGGAADLIITTSCFGTGTEYIVFSTGGRTYSCGQTIVQQLATFDSNTGSIVIQATGGSNTYVQWVLTGTATRR